MPISMLNETRTAIGADAGKCDSRSLFLDRFADPTAKDDKQSTPRKDWFNRLIGIDKKAVVQAGKQTWHPSSTAAVHARLMGRLMVNMAGGVMENANLLLDRYGLPIIPGSAVKGCARRMALQALHDWVEARTERPATDDACAPCCQDLTTPAEMLAAIARVFGWTPEDWKAEKNIDKKTKLETTWKSDFAWAVAGNHNFLAAAKELLPAHETFAGTIAFLSASPNRDPEIELDVLTPHHTIYYSPEPDKAKHPDKWKTWNAHRSAPDTEDPVPVFFPAVKPQSEKDYFTFPLIPLRRAASSDLDYAKRWLAHGLELFGLGAKTNAGYGWFDASEAFQKATQDRIEAQAKQQRVDLERKARETKEAEDREQKRLAKAALEIKLATLTPEEREDALIADLSEAQFDAKVRAFNKEPKKGGPSDSAKQAIVRALRESRLDYWNAFKTKATKAELATVDQAIRSLSKTMNLGKMP